MNKKLIITVLVIGVGMGGYFILRQPKWKVISIEKTDDGVKYIFKIGTKKLEFTSTNNTSTEANVNFPLYSFVLKPSQTLKLLDAPAIELTITKKIGDKTPKIIDIKSQEQQG